MEEFNVAKILSREFFSNMTPRLNQLSPELKGYFLKSIEENMSSFIAEGKRLEEIKRDLESLFKQYTTIIEILERIASETEISLQAQIPFVIPVIFKRIHTGASFDSTHLEQEIRELFTKIRIFEEVLREQKINMENFSVSIPEISQIIDEAPLEGFGEAIKKALLQIERRRSHGLLKTVLTNPLKFPLYSFLNSHGAVAAQTVVQSSPQLALSAPQNVRLKSKQPPPRTHFNTYNRKYVLSDVQPPPVVTKYKALSEANAFSHYAAQKEYWTGIIKSSTPEQQERDFFEVLKKGQLDICTLILNAGVNPNKVRVNPIGFLSRARYSSNDVRLQLISLLCSPQAEEMPSVKLPGTMHLTEGLEQSENSFVRNLLNRVFYKFGPIYLICAHNASEGDAVAMIEHLAHLPIHTEGNPYLVAVEQIQGKLQASMQDISRRINDIVDLFPHFVTPIDASLALTEGDKVWAHVDDTWKEMIIAGTELEDEFWPVAPRDAPADQAVPVKYTGIRFIKEADFRSKKFESRLNLYDRLKSDLIKITDLMKSSEMFTRPINVDELGEVNGHNITALIFACRQQSLPLISCLTELGANINIQYIRGMTPLMEAVRSGHVEVVQVLCSNPLINLALTDTRGNTALAYAFKKDPVTGDAILEESMLRIIQILIGDGPAPNGMFGEEQEPALNLAVQRRELPTIQYLLSLHLNPNQTNAMGVSPLMHASKRGSLPIVRLLLDNEENPANIDAIDAEGENAIFYALKNSRSIHSENAMEIIKYLIKKGINFRQQNGGGLNIYERLKNLLRQESSFRSENSQKLLKYLAKLLGCVGGVCRAVGIEGYGPNANTRRRAAAARAGVPPQEEAALIPVAPAGGTRRKRRTKKRGRARSRR